MIEQSPANKFPFPFKKKLKRRRVHTQEKVREYLLKLKPVRYQIRLPIKDKRGPFLFPTKGDIVGNCIQIRESVFIKMRKYKRIILVGRVMTPNFAYEVWKLKPRKRLRRRK